MTDQDRIQEQQCTVEADVMTCRATAPARALPPHRDLAIAQPRFLPHVCQPRCEHGAATLLQPTAQLLDAPAGIHGAAELDAPPGGSRDGLEPLAALEIIDLPELACGGQSDLGRRVDADRVERRAELPARSLDPGLLLADETTNAALGGPLRRHDLHQAMGENAQRKSSRSGAPADDHGGLGTK